MTSKTMMGVRLGLALLMAGTALGAAVAAQTNSSASRESAGSALTRHLRTIADQPRNVSALTGAGKAALELGDAQAALTFFARAEEIAPRDGRIKAGMGAAFVQMEQVHAGLKFFQEAASLGVSEAEFAGDRGLAHDLNGDPRRAQADYNLALRRQEDPEVRRRLALSLAISGDRDKAIATIDGQLRNQDRAAWRVRTFILALTGDAAEATRAAEAVMPGQAAQMRPFLAALPALRPSERAMAVHFGHFPNDGRALQSASAGTQYASAAPAAAVASRPGQQQTQLSRRGRGPETVSTAPRRRPGTEESKSDQPRQRRTSSFMAERYGFYDRTPAPQKKKAEPKPTVLADAGKGARRSAETAVRTEQPQVRERSAPLAEPSRPAQQPPVRAAETPPQPVPSAQARLASPTDQAPQGQTPPASGSTALSAGSTPPQSLTPGFDLGAAPPSPGQTQPTAAPGIQLAEIAPSEVQSQTGGSESAPPAEASPAPVASQQRNAPAAASQPVRANGLAAIAEAIEKLPGDSAPAASGAEQMPAAALQIAANTVAKPVYGPKFETPTPQTVKPAPAEKKSEPAKEAAPKSAAAKKDEPKAAAAKKDGDTKAAAAKKEAPTKLALAKKGEVAKKEEAAKPKESSRHWVQIAGGANEAAMTREFLRIKAKAPKLLAARTAWTTPLRATNRLLVGPFKTSAEAQEFVNELAKLELPAFSWTSPAGQEIVKLASK